MNRGGNVTKRRTCFMKPRVRAVEELAPGCPPKDLGFKDLGSPAPRCSSSRSPRIPPTESTRPPLIPLPLLLLLLVLSRRRASQRPQRRRPQRGLRNLDAGIRLPHRPHSRRHTRRQRSLRRRREPRVRQEREAASATLWRAAAAATTTTTTTTTRRGSSRRLLVAPSLGRRRVRRRLAAPAVMRAGIPLTTVPVPRRARILPLVVVVGIVAAPVGF